MYTNVNKRRINRLFTITILSFLLLTSRLFYIQWINRDYYKSKADKQFHYGENLSSLNYQLLSQEGRYLYEPTFEFVVVFNSKLFKLNDYANNLDKLMIINYIMKENYKDFDINKILENSSGNSYYYVNEASYNKILVQSESVKGIYAYKKESSKRAINWNIVNMLMNMKKFDGSIKDDSSLEGLINNSSSSDDVLQAMIHVDKNGLIKNEGFKLSKQRNVTLTLNKTLQETVEEVLREDTFEKFDQIGAIIIEAETGKIRAMGQKDDYKPNINIAATLQGYPPGSTFKLMVAEYALENNIITPDATHTCDGKYDERSHGTVNVERALNLSCNNFFIWLGEQFTANGLEAFAKEQGYFDQVLGIDEEIKGVINKPNQSEKNNNFVMGYSLSATPIQVAASLSAILNKGYYVKPILLEKLTGEDKESELVFNSEKKQVISKKTADLIKGYMRTTVLNGTGTITNIKGMEVGGKTGTSESIDEKSALHKHGWFAGYFEKDDKYYIMVCFIPDIDKAEEEKGELQGSSTAGLVFRTILERIATLKF